MKIELKELTPFLLNGWTYSELVHKEVWFVTRIYWGFFKKEALAYQELLEAWDIVFLKKDPTNKYDVNATEVRNKDWEFLWFLRKELAAELLDVDNFKVQVKNPYDWAVSWNKNSVWTEIIIVNLTNFKKINDDNKED